jgi:hypothetical protein
MCRNFAASIASLKVNRPCAVVDFGGFASLVATLPGGWMELDGAPQLESPPAQLLLSKTQFQRIGERWRPYVFRKRRGKSHETGHHLSRF